MQKRKSLYSTILILILLFATSMAAYAQTDQATGKIRGLVVDSETGEPLIGTNVSLLNTTYGTLTDMDGKFTINVPAGTYTLQASYIGYATMKVTDIKVEKNNASKVEISLKPESLDIGYEVVVTAKALQSSEAALLKLQQKSDKVLDGISAELMSKAGSSDAGDALKRVTGVTMVGKHTVVRGLGGRYSNSLLNGTKIPSPEPNRSIVPMDLFPAGLLDNVQIAKTFTPDQPGDFSGGSVQIKTKEFPQEQKMSASVSYGYNSQTTFDKTLTYNGGDLDFLGYDDGTRALPDLIDNKASDQPVRAKGMFSERGFTPEELEEFGESFQNVWSPEETTAPVNQGYSFSYGNNKEFWGKKQLGYLFSLTYSNDYNYKEGEYKVYNLGAGDDLEAHKDYEYESGTHSVLVGGIFNTNLRLSSLHKIGLKTIYNHTTDDEARIFEGWNEDRGAYLRNYRLRYIERGLISTQVSGDHHFFELFDSDISWKFTYSDVTRDEPDNREVMYEKRDENSEWQLFTDQSQSGSHFFFDLDEDEIIGSLDWSIPFRSAFGHKSKFKLGGLYQTKDRLFDVRRFRFLRRGGTNGMDLTAPPEEIFTEENIDSDNSNDRFELTESTNWEDSYKATHSILAGYAMVDMFLPLNIRFIGGARLEQSDQHLEINNPLGQEPKPGIPDEANLENTDILPSLNFVYPLGSKTNLRFAYTRTVARPDFRELAPYEFTNFVGGYPEKGNPELKRTMIDNADLRYETYPNPGELIAISVFYKYFNDPIEQYILPTAQLSISYDNADYATSYGVEVELRKSLGFLNQSLKNFSLSTNFTIMDTEVKIPDELGVQTSSQRALQGQSPYVINTMVAYDNLDWGTSANLMYNVWGRRIRDVGAQELPDVYEESRPQLDFILKQKLGNNISAKLSAKNLLDPYTEFTQDDQPTEKYKKGRSFSLGISYSL